MQKIIYSSLIAGSLLLCACQKRVAEDPAFVVKAEKTAYKIGDTVKFAFTGNPNHIVFYSGENGKKYENSTRYRAEGTPRLNFETSAQNGTQVNSLALMICTNFNGTYSPAGIAAATWTDITSRATMSTGAANVKSGPIDLSDFKSAERVHLAFKFTGQQDAASAQRQWTIKNFVLNNTLTDNTVVTLFANISAPNWLAVDVKNPDVKWATPSSTQLLINGGAANTPENEDWIITAGVNLQQITADVGTPLKDMTSRMAGYTYIYRTAGTYKATFLGINKNAYGEKVSVQEVEIKVDP